MKKIIILAAFALSLYANAGELERHKKPKGTKDTNVLDITKNRGTAIVYKTPAELTNEFNKEADLKMWSAEQKETERLKYPKGGCLILEINRMSIGAADTDGFTIVAQDNTGKEVFRKELKTSVASPVFLSGLTYWQNFAAASLPEELKTGSVVYVIDSLNGLRFEYLIKND